MVKNSWNLIKIYSSGSKSLDEIFETEKALLELRKKNEFFHNKPIEVMWILEND
jgi:hypothetical protein